VKVVSNAGPLIALGKLGQLRGYPKRYDCAIMGQLWIFFDVHGGFSHGYPDA
jgi:hypothetical protein